MKVVRSVLGFTSGNNYYVLMTLEVTISCQFAFDDAMSLVQLGNQQLIGECSEWLLIIMYMSKKNYRNYAENQSSQQRLVVWRRFVFAVASTT